MPIDRSPLVSVDELAARLGDPGLVVCDVRWYLTDPARGRRDYEAAHVPGARFVDLEHDLAAPSAADRVGGRHPLPSVEAFAATLGRLGITPGSDVVAYDAAGGSIAARLWWMLRSIGHERAGVLDGGFTAWERAGHHVAADVPSAAPTTYPVPTEWTGVVDADEVIDELRRGTTVIDARAAERYRGELEPIDPRAGHIPGAVNRPHLDHLDADGRHLPAAELARRFEGVGAAPIVHCGSGVTACHDLLAMAVAGITDGRLYAGSWSDWVADPDRPVATGP